MATDNSSPADRREFFRINDTVLVEYNIIESEQAEQLGKLIQNSMDPHVQKKTQLQSIQTAFTHLTDQINQYDHNLARALRLLDDKITIISNLLQTQQNTTDESQTVDANLSGGGIAFLAADSFDFKSLLEINIKLQPTGTHIHTVANVISCNKVDYAPKETPYFLRLAFIYMSEIDRNILVKHILNRQAEEIRNTTK